MAVYKKEYLRSLSIHELKELMDGHIANMRAFKNRTERTKDYRCFYTISEVIEEKAQKVLKEAIEMKLLGIEVYKSKEDVTGVPLRYKHGKTLSELRLLSNRSLKEEYHNCLMMDFKGSQSSKLIRERTLKRVRKVLAERGLNYGEE